MWVAVGAIAAAGIGYAASQSASNKGAAASNTAANLQAASSASALGEQARQFDYQQSLNEPFYKGSLPAYYQLVDAITGQRQTYQDPNNPAAQPLSDQEVAIANAADLKARYPWLKTDDDVAKHLGYFPEQAKFQLGQKYYRGADGTISTTPTQGTVTTTAYSPTETDAYKWQQAQAEKNNSRYLSRIGRSNSSYGMQKQMDSNQQLAALEYDKQLGRLADLTNIGRGAASSLAGSSAAYSNAAAGNIINNGNNMANSALAGGMMQQNSLYNGLNAGMGAINTGIKAYNAYNQPQQSNFGTAYQVPAGYDYTKSYGDQ